jgi:hypothetical protein
MRSVLYKLIIAASLVAGLFTLAGCLKDSCDSAHTYKKYIPVYMKLEDLRKAVVKQAPREIEQPGKIYVHGNYIFLNEVNKGIHVIDNSNPSAPNKFTFINIPGNVDMAVRGNILYADSYVDLVALDISDPRNAREVNRLEYTFPYRQYEFGIAVDSSGGKVIVDILSKDTTVNYACDGGGIAFTGGGFAFDAATNTSIVQSAVAKSAASVALGKAGSMSRFAQMDHYLYTVDNSSLKAFEVSTPSEPEELTTTYVRFGVETIFPYKQYLFIGSQTGLFIYDASTPAQPTYKGQFTHARRCDPVVVQDDIAYVTLRGGDQCAGNTNQLDVLDVKDVMLPRLIRSYPMNSPYGLGIDGSKLFICEGDAGLKFLNAERAADITTVKLLENVKAYDVIPHNNVLLVTAKDGLYQYDYSNLQAPRLLSKLSITVKQ